MYRAESAAPIQNSTGWQLAKRRASLFLALHVSFRAPRIQKIGKQATVINGTCGAFDRPVTLNQFLAPFGTARRVLRGAQKSRTARHTCKNLGPAVVCHRIVGPVRTASDVVALQIMSMEKSLAAVINMHQQKLPGSRPLPVLQQTDARTAIDGVLETANKVSIGSGSLLLGPKNHDSQTIHELMDNSGRENNVLLVVPSEKFKASERRAWLVQRCVQDRIRAVGETADAIPSAPEVENPAIDPALAFFLASVGVCSPCRRTTTLNTSVENEKKTKKNFLVMFNIRLCIYI